MVVHLPNDPSKVEITVTPREQVQEIRQVVQDSANGLQYSCFHFEHKATRINDYIELTEIPGLLEHPELHLVEDHYTERDVRLHLLRIRDLLAVSGRGEVGIALSPGASLFEHVKANQWFPPGSPDKPNDYGARKPMTTEEFADEPFPWDVLPDHRLMIDPNAPVLPRALKSLALSAWNPPSPFLKQRGYHLFIHLITNENHSYHITAHVSGFWVNRSTDARFDPAPRSNNVNERAHSLLVLLKSLSPGLTSTLKQLQDTGLDRDILTILQPANPSCPAYPWMVDRKVADAENAEADIGRSQTNLLASGVDNLENLRDWGEELASARELSTKSIQDRVARERLLARLYAEYNEAALRGAMLVASGDLIALNPTEPHEAQIFMYGNIFFSFGADGVGAFAKEGGFEAARTVVGLDVNGVRAVNQLDIEDVFTPGTGIIDYLGKRIVCQSVIPGIFKERKEGESQINYGGVDSRDVVAEDPAFVDIMKRISDALKVKRHTVWDKEGRKHELEGSVETKGILGTDGRKYVLDLYRLQPLDVCWIEKHWGSQDPSEDLPAEVDEERYPHRMSVLRPELIDAFWKLKRGDWINAEVARRNSTDTKSAVSGTGSGLVTTSKESNGTLGAKAEHRADHKDEAELVVETQKAELSSIDISDFHLTFNPDVFCGQKPQLEEEKQIAEADEKLIREVCDFLTGQVIPTLVKDLREGDVGFPMDGQSLTRTLHRRGVNVRYLGAIAQACEDGGRRLLALKSLAIQEMASRAFKHIANRQMAALPPPAIPACLAHLLNCFVGMRLNSDPVAEVDDELRKLYPECQFAYQLATAKILWAEIEQQIYRRYRYRVKTSSLTALHPWPCLRETALKLGIQVAARDYCFSKANDQEKLPERLSNGSGSAGPAQPATNGNSSAISSKAKKNKKKTGAGRNESPAPQAVKQLVTFYAEDILTLVPILKEASPKSLLAQEALEAGQMAILQGQKELGKELVFESLSLHEQIFGLIHPDVARVYYQLSNLYFQLDDKAAAVELAKKAVMVSERTLGLDSAETILAYLNLGLYEHAVGHSPMGLTFLKHGIKMLQLIYGPDHPDLVTTYNNGAVMLQAMRFYSESRSWFDMALMLCEELFGRQSVAVATLLFQLAQALALDSDSKASVSCMREAWSIFKTELGPEDKNTTESAQWLVTLTQNAVNRAKYVKHLEKQGIQVRTVSKTQWTTKPQAQAGLSSTAEAAKDASGAEKVDTRNLDELLKNIEGVAKSSPNASPKKRLPVVRHRKKKPSPSMSSTAAVYGGSES